MVVTLNEGTPTGGIASAAETLRLGIIGCGYWGQNLVRNFFESPMSTVTHVCDLSTERLSIMGSRYPTATLTQDYREILTDRDVDAVCIATQASTHFEIAKAALNAGKHVWVEKP